MISKYRVSPIGKDVENLRQELNRILGPMASRFEAIERALGGSPATSIVAGQTSSQSQGASPTDPSSGGPSSFAPQSIATPITFKGPVVFEGEVSILQQAIADQHPVRKADLPDPLTGAPELAGNPLNLIGTTNFPNVTILANTLTNITTQNLTINTNASFSPSTGQSGGAGGGGGISYSNGLLVAITINQTGLAAGTAIDFKFSLGAPFSVSTTARSLVDGISAYVSATMLFMLNSTAPTTGAVATTITFSVKSPTAFSPAAGNIAVAAIQLF